MPEKINSTVTITKPNAPSNVTLDKEVGGTPIAAEISEAAQTGAPEMPKTRSPRANAAQHALHEMHLRQSTLEQQNEALRLEHAALAASHARYVDLFNSAPISYCTVGESGLILEANLVAIALFGAPLEGVVGERFLRFVAEPDQANFQQRLNQAIAPDQTQAMDIQMVQHNGVSFWASLIFAVPTQPKTPSQPVAMRIVMSDITPRKQAEKLVRESEANYRQLFNLIDEGFCILEVIFDADKQPIDYRFIDANPAFEKQSGLVNVVGKRMSEVAPHNELYWAQLYGKVVVTGEPIRLVEEAKDLNRWFDVFAFRIGRAENARVGVLFSNITKQRKLDGERLDLSRLLEVKNTNLEIAMLLADKANQAKSDFLSSMSHELRTPLGAILGFAQLLEVGPPVLEPIQKRSVEQILQAGWYLLDLINEILDLALIESGKLSLSVEPVSLTQAMQECQMLVEAQAQKSNICITFPSAEVNHYAQADYTRVKQVLLNMLSNAIKYNNAGGSVVVRNITSGTGRIRVCVEDSGDGLTADQITHLFQPFNRLGQETKAEQGTGIGLVVCKRLVELMGGLIGVDSIVGKGSVFWFELNLAAVPMPMLLNPNAAMAATAPLNAILPKQALGKPAKADVVAQSTAARTLLYVEDNPANLLLMAEITARLPHVELISATDGKAGLALAMTSIPDVILMDINLPGMSGITTLAHLLADPKTAHIPVIALSANAMPYDIENGLGLGFFRYLTKPLKVPEFLSTLELAFALQDAKLTAKAKTIERN